MGYFTFDNVTHYSISMKGSIACYDGDLDESIFANKDSVTVYPTDSDSFFHTFANPTIHIIKQDDGKTYFRIYSNPVKYFSGSKNGSEKNNENDAIKMVARIVASSFTDEQAVLVKDIYETWRPDTASKTGQYLVYNGVLYKVNQNHTSQSDWLPGSGTDSLYTAVKLNTEGYPVWSMPSGAHDAYNIGDIVEYNGVLYKSLIDGNVWSPDGYPQGWQEYDASTSTEPSTPDPGTETPTEPSEPDYPDFVQPTGAHDAYKKGDIVRYNGKLYQSLIDANTYSPDAYPQGWQEYSEE